MKIVCFLHKTLQHFAICEVEGSELVVYGIYEHHPACLEMTPQDQYEEYLASHQLTQDEAVVALNDSMDQILELLS